MKRFLELLGIHLSKDHQSSERRSFVAGMSGIVVGSAVLGMGSSAPALAAEPDAEAKRKLQPVPLDPAVKDGVGLDSLIPWPKAMMLRPIATHRVKQWYTGEKLSAMVYDADDGLLQFTDLPYDEQVTLLRGTATLISQDGQRHVFHAGDTFIAPKGWTGTWELKGGYRELITFETASLDYAMKKWFG